MLLRLRRPTTLLLTALLPASLALAACGSDDSELKGFDAVSISGKVGETPKLDWKGTMTAEAAKSKVVTKGDGAALKDGDIVKVEFTLADGWTHKVTYDSYQDTKLSRVVRIGAKAADPTSLSDVLALGLDGQIKAGQTIGSRIAVTVGSDKAFGNYFGSQAASLLADLDIGNEDGMLYVADIVGLAKPEGATQAAPAWAPKVVEKDGIPTGLDFTGVPAPNGQLRVAVLTKGTGPVVKSGQETILNYVGQLAKGKKPFDESFTRGGFTAVLGGAQASVVKGWSQGLVGQTVGSRVILEIPPSLGYGNKAQGTDIPANSTLYFVVDVLDTAKPEPTPAPTGAASPSGSTSAPASPSATPSQ
ncbi:FKBP-type peptidyl-prolyl cis-trans isomerase [Nocardioides sp. LML1-1-1.1]|uniref:FKBP-type peptidyl-prolyl cis-trans isomerase n=1 Tax=Nocardioides sp. LML1-1-1.1 TaxID=3135248 RepID=UPI0034438C44